MMDPKQLKKALFIFVCLSMFISRINAQDTLNNKHIEVSMRMIGHQVLLSSNDSTSRVLPIIKIKDRYRIQFENEFVFNPEELVSTIDQVVKETGLSKRYIVEVEDCETGEVVYSFKVDEVVKTDIIPCKSRVQPKSCYSLLITLLEVPKESAILQTNTNDPLNGSHDETSGLKTVILSSIVVLMAVIFFLLWKRRNKVATDPNMIHLGEYQFDKRNTELIIEQQRIELTSKEADLLLLLYDAANTTVEREVILNLVWGDEGDYVGRTLDVFISKLRKKLEFDSKVKIVNIRGIGYKLVMNV